MGQMSVPALTFSLQAEGAKKIVVLAEDPTQYADGVVLAGVAARAVLGMQADATPGMLGAELEAGSDFRFVVHQASGMVSAQLEVTVGEALARMRAFAFAHDHPLAKVAEDVVARRLRFS
jgi:hypothetical protein